MRAIKFAKYQGLGNDFILTQDLALASPRAAVQWCNRHLGIGADGIILLSQPSSHEALIAMKIYNSDGSIAEMCGNGLRCVAKWLQEEGRVSHLNKPFLVETDIGLKRFDYVNDDLMVEMGEARVQPILLENGLSATAVWVGNPHLVIEQAADLEEVQQRGPLLSKHPSFPNGCNVGFVEIVEPHKIKLLVWERGAGLTQACGTGACAAVAALVMQDKLPNGVPIDVQLLGGRLGIIISREAKDRGRVSMRGPAVKVFEGIIYG